MTQGSGVSAGMVRKCPHLQPCRDGLFKSLDLVLTKLAFPVSPTDAQLSCIRCEKCHRRAVPTMCACLSCPTFACMRHFGAHEKQTGHELVVTVNFGQLYCLKCNDFVYERRAERVRLEAENSYRRRLGLGLRNQWNPSGAERRLLKHGPKTHQLGPNSLRGLRGLVNLGNTCFMNCIIQSLVHIPHLRDYFLTDQHQCRQCSGAVATDAAVGQGGALKLAVDDLCLMCELANICQEFYNGRREPFIPRNMLHLVWKHAEHLAGYEQHDAHEFLIAALNVLHQHSECATLTNGNECKCIIDRLFTGRLQSDLTCMKCGRVSTTVDPFWDISLDLGDGTAQNRTLEDCLANYVKPEALGAAKIRCEACSSYESATKKLTLETLPLVACFHLKRFEHTVLNRRKKIRIPVRFPEQIDLTPYTTPLEAGGGKTSAAHPTARTLARSSNVYDLLCVVNHNGNTDSGHYTCFVRHHMDQWYKCNDQVIYPEVLESVLASEGYLLFYTKSFVDYN